MTAVGPHWGYPDTRVLRKPIDKAELVAVVRQAACHAPSRATSG
jgi:hypothetical protein